VLYRIWNSVLSILLSMSLSLSGISVLNLYQDGWNLSMSLCVLSDSESHSGSLLSRVLAAWIENTLPKSFVATEMLSTICVVG
jgi:hypothetical protein